MDDWTTAEAGPDDETPPPVRQQTWPCAGVAELDLGVDVGPVTVRMEPDATEVHVELRHDPSAATGFTQGLGGLINWLGGSTPEPSQAAAEAVREAEISWSESDRRLTVRSSQDLALRTVPLSVTVTAPARSRLTARTGSGDVTVHGRAGAAAVRTGSGAVRVEQVDGEADVTTGSGELDLGPVAGRARLRTGSGDVRLAAAAGPTEIKAGSGDVHIGEVVADLGVRTGSGSVAVADARDGGLDLTTGSGDIRIGVHPGTAAELDLSSGTGRARSDLEVGADAPAAGGSLRVRGRTGTGDVLVTRATVSA